MSELRAAIVAAVVAALVAGGGGAFAASYISGRSIRPHSIPLNRLSELPPAGLENVSRVTGREYVVQPSLTGYAEATCPRGEIAVSGGFAVVAQVAANQIVGLVSEPMADLSGWVSGFEDHGTTPATVVAYALCARGSQASS